MTPAEMFDSCIAAITAAERGGVSADRAAILLTTPKGWRPPPGFPRGDLACVNPRTGNASRYFPAARLALWLAKACEAAKAEGQP